jgi:hypothetical protein
MEVALRFTKAKVTEYGRGAEGTCEYWTGQIEAIFYGNPIYPIPSGTSSEPDSDESPKSDSDSSLEPDKTTTTTAPVPFVASVWSIEYARPRKTHYSLQPCIY